MKSYLLIAVLAIACVALLSLPSGVSAQSSDITLSIGTSTATVTRGTGVTVFALVENNSSSRTRTNVTLSSLSPCGDETILGEQRVSLMPGQAVAISVYYPIPESACVGTHSITITASSKGPNKDSSLAAIAGATTFVEVN